MHHITLDTNTWIYLANGTEPVKLLTYIHDEVENGNIQVLLPEIIITEWKNHKDKTVRKGASKHIQEVQDALEKILKLLGNKGEKDALSFLLKDKEEDPYFKDIFDSFNKKKKEIEDAVDSNIQQIDDLFKHNAIIIPAKSSVHETCAQFAIAHKAPFKGKNSYADALLLFSLFDYLKEHAIEDAFFISYNTEDFCEKKGGKKELHQDLVTEFSDAKCKYFKTVGEALQTIKEDIVTQKELEMIKFLQEEPESEYCQVCFEEHQRLNIVYYGQPADLIDERGLKDKIFSGSCDWCGILHFKCVECGEINNAGEEEYDKPKECEGCGQAYIIQSERNEGYIESIQIIIPKKKMTCDRCGDECDLEDMVENICRSCEDEYAYGDR